MSRTIQITNSKNTSSPWVWQWDSEGKMIVPQGGDIVTANGRSLMDGTVTQNTPQSLWQKYTVSALSGGFVVTDNSGQTTNIDAVVDCEQRIPLFRLPAGGYLSQAVLSTQTRFVCDSAVSITCGLGMEQYDSFFVPCTHEVLAGRVGSLTHNSGHGTSELSGGTVFLTIDVLGSVVAAIEAGSVDVWVHIDQLPI